MKKDISLNIRIYDPLLAKPLKPLRNAILEALPEDKDTRILDLCCGTGNQLLTLEQAGYKNLHGLDLDPGMVAYAKQNSALIQYHEGDATNTSFPDASFDVVIISLALHEKDQALREKIFKEISCLLKPGGYVLAADFAFDDKSTFWGRAMISVVEFNAGGEHYRNFKDYTRRGGLPNVLPEGLFEYKEVDRVLRNGIGIWELKLI
ncbi:MAG: class I SAM-dependent methyltransferase [Candidatus Marinimicrobia bacterium]|nr:class I SAM-dependent methyltransferase [Candidatus Neomarinimicrobiota bacterium]